MYGFVRYIHIIQAERPIIQVATALRGSGDAVDPTCQASTCSGVERGGIDMDGHRSFKSAKNSTALSGHVRSSESSRSPGTAMAPDRENLDHYSRGDVDDETTRYLAATAQVDIKYARSVRRRIIGEPFRALAPIYGADLAVVARWALSSLRRRYQRDVVLAVIFASAAALFWILQGHASWHAWIPVFVIISFVAVIGVVAGEKFQIRRTVVTHMRRGVFNSGEAPQPKSWKSRERLAAVADRRDGNLVIFQGKSAFVGSGRLVRRWHLVLDVSRGAKLSDGARQEPVEFTSADLHAEIVDALNHIGLPYAHAEERLFVNGRHLQDNPDLLTGWDPLSAPPAYVDGSVLRRAALDRK